MQASPSSTAMMTAVQRGRHLLEDPPPWVLRDSLALELVGPGWRDMAERSARLSDELNAQIRASMVVRSRYAEDQLAAGSFRQYVILGAGLDSFAWRRPPGYETLSVFEVDHPSSQAWKRERVAELGLPIGDHHVFVAVDFESQSLPDRLEASGFDRSQPTLFSWLGVTMYLTNDAVETTLRNIATCAPGSRVVLEYGVTRPFLDDLGEEFRSYFTPVTSDVGEAVHSLWSPSDVESLVSSCGLEPVDHPSRDQLVERYFQGRDDGLQPWSVSGLLTAQVPSAAGEIRTDQKIRSRGAG